MRLDRPASLPDRERLYPRGLGHHGLQRPARLPRPLGQRRRGQVSASPRPTVAFTPVTGEQLAKSYLTAIPPSDLFFLIQIPHPERRAGRSGASGGRLVDQRASGLEQHDRGRAHGGPTVLRADRPSAADPECRRPGPADRPVGRDAAGVFDLARHGADAPLAATMLRVKGLLGVEKKRDEFEIIKGRVRTDDDKVAVLTRSALEILNSSARSSSYRSRTSPPVSPLPPWSRATSPTSRRSSPSAADRRLPPTPMWRPAMGLPGTGSTARTTARRWSSASSRCCSPSSRIAAAAMPPSSPYRPAGRRLGAQARRRRPQPSVERRVGQSAHQISRVEGSDSGRPADLLPRFPPIELPLGGHKSCHGPALSHDVDSVALLDPCHQIAKGKDAADQALLDRTFVDADRAVATGRNPAWPRPTGAWIRAFEYIPDMLIKDARHLEDLCPRPPLSAQAANAFADRPSHVSFWQPVYLVSTRNSVPQPDGGHGARPRTSTYPS